MPRRGRVSDEDWLAIRDDPRPHAEIALRFKVTREYVRGIKDGTYTRKTATAQPRPKPPRPIRHYRPFRDGTYS